MRLLLACVGLALAVGCGGGGGGGTAGPVIPPNPEGIYRGVVNTAGIGQLGAYGVALPNGDISYYASNGYLAFVNLNSEVGYMTNGDGISSPGITLSGVSISPGTSATGSYAVSTGDRGTFQFTYCAEYASPKSLSTFAGTYTAHVTRYSISSMTIDDHGNITGTNSEGPFTGTISLINPTENLYEVMFFYGGVTYSGLGFWAGASATEWAVPNGFYVLVRAGDSRAWAGQFQKN